MATKLALVVPYTRASGVRGASYLLDSRCGRYWVCADGFDSAPWDRTKALGGKLLAFPCKPAKQPNGEAA